MILMLKPNRFQIKDLLFLVKKYPYVEKKSIVERSSVIGKYLNYQL